MTTVACVLKRGRLYDSRWADALYRGLARHMPETWRFVCLSDDPDVPGYVPLEHGWPGWWSKVELFRPDLFDGPVLYMDLDTLPVGDLTDLASYSGDLAVLSDLYRTDRMASGVMAWTPGEHTERIYRKFCKDPEGIMAAHRSRSDHWYRKVWQDPDRLQDLYPGQIVSFKAHARQGVPQGARLVCGHGKPRFSDPDAGWAHRLWTRRAA